MPALSVTPPVRRLLVVDDEPAIRRLVRLALSAHIWEVLEAGDGAEGWAMLQAERVDVALVDLRMPQLDGLALLRRARGDARLARLPFVVFTGSVDDVAGFLASYRGVEVLTKPFSLADLGAMLARATLRADARSVA